jgi:hypothetical protein
MSIRDDGFRVAGWLAPVGWLAAIVCLGLWLVAPVVRLDPRTFAWGTALCTVFAALGHLARFRRVQSSRSLATPEQCEPRRKPELRDARRPSPIRRPATPAHGRNRCAERMGMHRF